MIGFILVLNLQREKCKAISSTSLISRNYAAQKKFRKVSLKVMINLVELEIIETFYRNSIQLSLEEVMQYLLYILLQWKVYKYNSN